MGIHHRQSCVFFSDYFQNADLPQVKMLVCDGFPPLHSVPASHFLEDSQKPTHCPTTMIFRAMTKLNYSLVQHLPGLLSIVQMLWLVRKTLAVYYHIWLERREPKAKTKKTNKNTHKNNKKRK